MCSFGYFIQSACICDKHGSVCQCASDSHVKNMGLHASAELSVEVAAGYLLPATSA